MLMDGTSSIDLPPSCFSSVSYHSCQRCSIRRDCIFIHLLAPPKSPLLVLLQTVCCKNQPRYWYQTKDVSTRISARSMLALVRTVKIIDLPAFSVDHMTTMRSRCGGTPSSYLVPNRPFYPAPVAQVRYSPVQPGTARYSKVQQGTVCRWLSSNDTTPYAAPHIDSYCSDLPHASFQTGLDPTGSPLSVGLQPD